VEIGEQDIRVPIMDEELVAENRPVIKEELIAKKRAVEETEEVEAEFAKDWIDVDERGLVGLPGHGPAFRIQVFAT
jgi:uncharacterized protein (TIGR02271 family)